MPAFPTWKPCRKASLRAPSRAPFHLRPLVGGRGGTYGAPLLIPAPRGRHLEVPATGCRDEHHLTFPYGSMYYGRFTAVAHAPIGKCQNATAPCAVVS